MGLWRYAQSNRSTVPACGQWFRDWNAFLKIELHGVGHQISNPGQGLFRRFVQVTQQIEFGAQRNALFVLIGPEDPVPESQGQNRATR